MPVPAGGDSSTTDYTDLDTVKAALGKTSDDERDELIAAAIAAASRAIDQRTGRRFYADTATSARTYPACGAYVNGYDSQSLRIDDVADSTGMTVESRYGFGGSWSTVATWELGPDSAAALGQPWNRVVAAAGWLSPAVTVRVTATWGWLTVPDAITQAATLLAARLYRRKDSPQGVIGSAEWGQIRVSRMDPDVESLIAPYVAIIF
jgi:hypothetical protein